MTAVEQSMRAAVSESEGRTTRAIGELRADLNTWRQAFMPHERIEDRWRRDDARLAEHDRHFDEQDTRLAEHEKLLSKLATKDDITDTVKEACAGFVTESQVKDIVANHRSSAISRRQQIVLWAVAVLSFLSSQGLIHPLALFTGGKP